MPPPSTDETAWWDSAGTFGLATITRFYIEVLSYFIPILIDRPDSRFPSPPPNDYRSAHTNPFDEPPSASSSSDEELYTKAQALPELRLPRKAPPPLPSRPSS